MKPLREWIGNWAVSFLAQIAPSKNDTPTASSPIANPDTRVLLHVGCGHATLERIPLSGFHNENWEEVRLDVDKSVHPDIVGTMVNMEAVPNEFANALYSSHNIEHLYPHEVPLALAEFKRVLAADGFLVLTCPDLQSLCQLVAEDKLLEPAYISPAGAITPLDVLYGHRSSMAAGNLYMAHRCGFTLSTLIATLKEAGFAAVLGARRPDAFDLWVLASKSPRTQAEMEVLAKDYLLPNYQPPQGD